MCHKQRKFLLVFFLMIVGAAASVWYLTPLYREDPATFWNQALLLIAGAAALFAGVSAIAACRSLELTRDTMRAWVFVQGTIHLGNASALQMRKGISTLELDLRNTGTAPAEVLEVKVQPFKKDEQINLENTSAKYQIQHIPHEVFLVFPGSSWHPMLNLDMGKTQDRRLLQDLVQGLIKLRLTTRYKYEPSQTEHRTVQTFEYDQLSPSADGAKLDGFARQPQKAS